jgi:hypothetical protein
LFDERNRLVGGRDMISQIDRATASAIALPPVPLVSADDAKAPLL